MRKTILRLLAATLLWGAAPLASFAAVVVGVGVSITVAPPALPVYVQPACPGIGYMWTPGYWAWGPAGYYWVPGTWVLAPAPGLLWTPGYWGWVNGVYVWHGGYWGPHVGFYGGVNYGFGYTGVGFRGGYWHNGAFFYNRAVMNLGGLHPPNVYSRAVPESPSAGRVSFNGGEGGLSARPTPGELRAEHEHHMAVTALQAQHERQAMSRPELRASANNGRPAFGATPRPGAFPGRAGGGAERPPAHPQSERREGRPGGQPQEHGRPQERGGNRGGERPKEERRER